MKRLFAVLFCGLLGLVPLFADDAVEADFKVLQGVWTVVGAELDGQPLDRIKGNTLTVKGQRFTIKTQTITLEGTLTLDPSKKPRAMDWNHEADSLKDKVWQAIYEVEGDDLRICYAVADSETSRPRDFETSANSNLQRVTLRREK